MNNKELNWKTKDGISIYGKIWNATNEPKYLICLIHGMGEHIERYAPVAQFFNEHNIAVMAYDQRGHGKSGGQRGHFTSFDDFLDDVDLFLNECNRHFPNVKKIIFGHSMGGNVVSNYLIRRNQNFSGAILSSPYLELAFTPPAIKVQLGRFMKNILPSLSLPSGLDASAISRDKSVVDSYLKDKLVHDKISARMGIDMIESGKEAIFEANKIKLPILIYHGTADRLTSHDGSQKFAKNVGSNATFISYDGLYHETHNEPEKETVFQNILNWINNL
jgi:acylglycerol lipase